MRGVEDKPGWFWLFLIEGLLTFMIGLIVCFLHCMFPLMLTTTEFLLPPQLAYQYQERPLSQIMVYRETRSDHGQRTSPLPFILLLY